MLDPERDAVRLAVVEETDEQNGEFVAAEASQGIALPQARLEPARHRDEQFVADQVTEAVVDDLEAIEIEIQHCKAAVDGTQLHLLEPATKTLDKYLAVEQPGQRVHDTDAAEPFLCDCLLGGVGQRAGDAVASTRRAFYRQAAAEEPPVGAILMQNSMLMLEHL